VKSSGWREKFRQLPEGRGIGLACSAYLTGAGLPIYWNKMPHSGVQLKFDRGGGVTLFCGATEIGQGSDDVLASIVAEVLGLDTFDIRLYTGDTDLGPVDLGSYSSRVTIMAGKRRAASRRARKISTSRSRERTSRGSGGAPALRRQARLRFSRSRKRSDIPGRCLPGRSALRHHRHGRLLHTTQISGPVQRWRRGAVAYVFLQPPRWWKSSSIQ